MSHRVAGAPLDFAALRSELEVPGDFSPDLVAEAGRAAAAVELPDADATDVPFVTIDPAGSRDLDQALHIGRDGSGYLVSYAIADVGAFVRPGSPLDLEAHARGETFYFPDARVPLYPPELSEGAASLLPGELRPAILWRVALDETGEPTRVDVTRARVRSRAQLDYVGVQQLLATDEHDGIPRLLGVVGELLLARARDRHAIDLDLPEQEVERGTGNELRLAFRAPLPVERYNAQISLLTGRCAARLMLDARIGLLRVVPAPHDDVVRKLRSVARALGVDWPAGAAPGDVLSHCDRANPRHVALLEHAGSLLRGADYVAFDGAAPSEQLHAGIGAPYAHVTAPLRRLVDRFGLAVCVEVGAGAASGGAGAVSADIRSALPGLPDVMRRADHLAHEADRAVVDATEAWLLHDRIGAVFHATVIDSGDDAGTVLVEAPAIRARCDGAKLPLGDTIDVRLVTADVASRTVRFEAVSH